MAAFEKWNADHDFRKIDLALRNLYAAFQDDVSKKIFSYRFQYWLTGDSKWLNKLGLAVCDVEPQLCGKEVILYGTGKLSEECLESVRKDDVRVAAFCDSHPCASEHLGLPVISKDELLAGHRDKNVLIASSLYADEIYEELIESGFSQERILLYGKHNKMYFHESFLKPAKDECYIYVGCLDGETIEGFISFNGGYKRIVVLEPDKENYRRTANKIKGIPNVELIDKGAWSGSGLLRFDGKANADSAISESGDSEIQVIAIDEIVDNEKVTFIKMDIEGAEYDALKGAGSVILRNAPKLAICVYHAPEDIVRVPLYLQSLVPDYKFYLRHHNYYPFWRDTVLYAVSN
jgi:FkbM family methyltransferase